MIDKDIYDWSMFLQRCGWQHVTFVVILLQVVIIKILVPRIFDYFYQFPDDFFMGDLCHELTRNKIFFIGKNRAA
jgi:hypothetical protein